MLKTFLASSSKFLGAAVLSHSKSAMSRSFHVASLAAVGRQGHLFSPARVQHPAPAFAGTAVVNGDFKEIKLSDYNGKWLVLVFYPLDFTFVCPTELVKFSDRISEFKEAGAEVVGISTDSHFSHLAWTKTPRKEGGVEGLTYPLLADFRKQMASDYGVLVDAAGVALRGLFLIDPKGIIRHAYVNDLPVGRSVDETLRVLHAFQHFEKHGEVCPANWTPRDGSAGAIKPDPVKSREYFEKS